MELPTTRDGKPVLDEATFQKLLAAAYVLQQHQERTRAAEEASRATQVPEPDYAHTLAEIVETQHQILIRHLDLDGAAGYIVEQVQKITSATGAAVGLLDRDHLVYRAVSGRAAAELGSALPKDRAMSAAVLTQALVLRCPNVRLESHIDQQLANRAGIESFLAVPIFHDDQVAGVLELVFSRVNGYTEYDVHTGQMMAGLVTEALARADDERWKRSLADERDSMLEALEKLKPQLDRLAKDAESLSASATPRAMRTAPVPVSPESPAVKHPPVVKAVELPRAPQRPTAKAPASGDQCKRCGNHLGPQEVYCGSCGTLRSERPAPGQRSESPSPALEDPVLAIEPDPDSSLPLAVRMAEQKIELPPEVLALVQEEPPQEAAPDVADDLLKLLPPEDWEGASPEKPEPVSQGYPWTSAAHARTWLNSMADPKSPGGLLGFLRTHRGDVSLVAAILLVLVAIFWSRADRPAVPNLNTTTSANSGPAATTLRPQGTEADPQPELSFWDRTLIALGLAEAPPTPPQAQPTGNPEVSVWVDLQTALYYCPGADLYGKTPKGRFTTQREARNDRFEAASGRVCE